MNYIIIGYGKMGKAIDKIAKNRNYNLIGIIDNENDWTKLASFATKADIAFEFTKPNIAADNIKRCFNHNIPVVCGTTAWLDKFDEIKQICLHTNNSLFYASNFSVGVNIMMEINRQLAKIMNNMEHYKISIEETHHIHKLDAPSGTAVVLAKDIIEKIKRLNKFNTIDKASDDSINIFSFREGEVVGIHNVIYESLVDKIELKHSFKSRESLASGAIMAAEWLIGKKGVFSMFDLLGFGSK